MEKYLLTIKENTLEAYKHLSDKEYVEFMESAAVNYAQGLTYDGVNIHIEMSLEYNYDFISEPTTYENVKKAKESLEAYFKDYITVSIIKQPL